MSKLVAAIPLRLIVSSSIRRGDWDSARTTPEAAQASLRNVMKISSVLKRKVKSYDGATTMRLDKSD
jgi:hypothetical protein